MRFTVFTIALLLRLAVVEGTGATASTFGDAHDYVSAARSVCTGQPYPDRGGLPFFRAPGLPFFIAAVTGCHPGNTRLVKYALAVCDSLTVVLLFELAGLVWSSRLAALLAAAMAALHPFFIGAVTDIQTEPLFMLLLVAGVWCAVSRRPAAAGALLALAALTRPTALLAIPLVALFVAIWPSRRWRAAAVLLLAAGLTLLPWTVRNVLRYGEPIVVNDAGGFSFWRGTTHEMVDTLFTTDRDELARISTEFETRRVPAAAAIVDARAATPAARSRVWSRMALANLRAEPRFAIRATFWKGLLFWRPWLHPAEHGRAAVVISGCGVLLLFAFGGAGMVLAPDRRLAVSTAVFLAIFWLAHLPYIPTIRLRYPLTDPLLIVFAAGPVVSLFQRLSRTGVWAERRPPYNPPLDE